MSPEIHVVRDTHGNPVSINFPRPSDLHAHFRWDDLIAAVTPEILRHHLYVLAMPNNGPGEGGIIRKLSDAVQVRNKIIQLRNQHHIQGFSDVLMTLYHTSDITPRTIDLMKRWGRARAVKNYPVHRKGTTNSGHGVPFDEDDEVIRAMEETGIPLLIHAEDVLDKYGKELPHAQREGHCVRERLWKFRDMHPHLRICVEHGSTEELVRFVKADTSGRTVMTATPHHCLFTIKDMDELSWRNHLRCMPYVKTLADREAVARFAMSGDYRCIAGSDSAPHPSTAKNKPFEEAACGCWMPHSIALYALAFMRHDALDERFVNFMSYNGPDWWGLLRPDVNDTITIRTQTEGDIPDPTPLPKRNDVIIPLGWTRESDRLKVGLVTS